MLTRFAHKTVPTKGYQPDKNFSIAKEIKETKSEDKEQEQPAQRLSLAVELSCSA